ncbi:unnamed protein product [Toxocara canis]|uniref:Tyrosine-protein phosphatase domain-containing protein n=1 Tax=Toxocara canis TaxID=6265 RepID=A0A3P7FLL3_TOXCA|nr:unnamed protein product [Toxocara canis]
MVKEFMDIKKSCPPPAQLKKTAFDKNTDKNRYKDVYCTDDTRVVLSYPEGGNDYIHANWVDIGESKHRFICTQAPKANTVADFWRMVWQEKSKAIVMLCNIMECGKKKCEQYWPDKKDETVSLLKTFSLQLRPTKGSAITTRAPILGDMLRSKIRKSLCQDQQARFFCAGFTHGALCFA